MRKYKLLLLILLLTNKSLATKNPDHINPASVKNIEVSVIEDSTTEKPRPSTHLNPASVKNIEVLVIENSKIANGISEIIKTSFDMLAKCGLSYARSSIAKYIIHHQLNNIRELKQPRDGSVDLATTGETVMNLAICAIAVFDVFKHISKIQNMCYPPIDKKTSKKTIFITIFSCLGLLCGLVDNPFYCIF